jgi:hypothetical protein
MNCANHPDRERAAFCQNCGKPLCTECVRNAGTSIFCEQCLAARVAASAPPVGYAYTGAPGYTSVPSGYPHGGPPTVPSEPNPGLAALLGFIPGVGAMYNEQYAKGIVHLIVFAVLVSLAHDIGIFGIFIPGWIIYMVIEAHHTARARRDGTPLPNPFGLNDISERLGFGKAWPAGVPPSAPYGTAPNPDPMAGPTAYPPQDPTVPPSNPYAPPYSYTYVPPVSHWGAAQEATTYGVPPASPYPPVTPVPSMPVYPDPNVPYHRRFPSGAIWLIGMGLFFLLGNMAIFHIFQGRLFGPLLLIGVGVWLFVRKMTSTGHGLENDGTPLYHWRLANAMGGSFWIILTGFIWLLDGLHILSWSHSWPLFMIGGGVMMFFRRTMYPGYFPGGYAVPPSAPPPTTPVTTTDLVASDPQQQPGNDNQEGR